jgi:hypothetical protein
VPWAEVTDMEDGIEVQVKRELKIIVKVSDSFKDLVRAELSGSKLRCFLVDLDILSCKPDHVSDFEDMGCTFVSFELFFHLFLG